MKFLHNPNINISPRAQVNVCQHLMTYHVTRPQNMCAKHQKEHRPKFRYKNGKIKEGHNSELK